MTGRKNKRRSYLWLLGVVLIGWTCAGRTARAGGTPEVRSERTVQAVEEKLGIQIVAVRLSAGGSIVDFRYRVLDPARAHACLARDSRPCLEDTATGARLVVPQMPYVGALRQTSLAPEKGKVYFILFGNGAKTVKRGSVVTVILGGEKIESLRVE